MEPGRAGATECELDMIVLAFVTYWTCKEWGLNVLNARLSTSLPSLILHSTRREHGLSLPLITSSEIVSFFPFFYLPHVIEKQQHQPSFSIIYCNMNGSSISAPVEGTQNSPNAAQRPPRPKKKPLVNPLVTKRRPGQKPKTQTSRPPPNPSLNKPGASQPAPQPRAIPPRPAFTERPRSPTPEGKPTIWPVYTSQRALLEGLRNHIARLQSRDDVNVTDETAFTRPVRLHRRDPNAKSNAPVGPDADTESKNDEDEKEKERFEAIKAERQRIREETAKMIAPSVSKKKPMAGKKKIESIRGFETAEDEKRRTLRYEEALPWHLEDFDNKHTWVGSYEATLSDCHVMFVAGDDHFRVVPLEKWYRFREKSRFKHLDADEAEAMMKKRTKEPRWLLAHKQRDEMAKQREKEASRTTGLYKRSGEQDDTKGELFGLGGNAGEDGEDLDFDADELFDDDDEENPFVDAEDEEKDAKERIKKEQLNANIFDLADEKDVDEEEERAQKLAQLQRQLEKGTRKVLVRHEKDHLYDDSDEGNPYTSEVSIQIWFMNLLY
jgi:transcription initiation factor TFIIF subunit alpha